MNKIAKEGKLEIKKSLLLVQDALFETKDIIYCLLLKAYIGSDEVFSNPGERLDLIIDNINIVNNELLISMDNYNENRHESQNFTEIPQKNPRLSKNF